MSRRSSNTPEVPQAKDALDRFKFEVANEIGVPLKQGYNGDLTSRENGFCRRRNGSPDDSQTGRGNGKSPVIENP